MKLPRHLLVFFTLLAVALASFFSARGTVQPLGGMDHISALAPMNQPAPDRPWDVLQADGALQFYVWRDLVFESWGKGRVPGWNPYELCGTPLLANSQSGGFYPLHILMGVLHVPTRLAVLLLAVIHLSLSVLGVVLLTRQLGAKPVMQWVTGIGFGYSAFFLSWIGLSSVPTTICWIPWALWGLVSMTSWQHLWRVAVPVGMMILGGHLQFATYGLLGGLACWMALLMIRKDRKPVLLSVLGVALGFMIAAPQLLPVLDYGKNSHRRDTPSADGFKGYTGLSVTGPEWLAALVPQTLGNPDVKNPSPIKDMPENISASWINLTKPGGNYAESAFGIGAIMTLALALAARKLRGERLVLGLTLILFATLLATPSPLAQLMYFNFPGWQATGSPGRAMVLFLLGGLLLASGAEGLDTKSKPSLIAFAGGALAALIGIPLAISMALGPEGKVVVQAMLQPQLLLVLGLVAVGGFALWAVQQLDGDIPLPYALAGALLPALLLFRAPDAPPHRFEGQFKSERVAILNDKWSLWVRPPAQMPGNLAALNRFREAAGYDSLIDKKTFELMGSMGSAPTPPENGNMVFTNPAAKPAMLQELGVTQILGPDGTITPLGGPGLVIGSATVESDEPGHVKLRSKDAGMIGFRERAIQGWSATVNGQHMPLVAGLWLQVDAPADATVEFTYSPPGMKGGLGLLALATLILGAIGLKSRPRNMTGE